MNKKRKLLHRILSMALIVAMVAGFLPQVPVLNVEAAFSGTLKTVSGVTVEENVATISFNEGAVQGKLTFLDDGIFRYNVDPSGTFSEYAAKNNAADTAKITQYPDSSDAYSHPAATVAEDDTTYTITSGKTTIQFGKETAKMTVLYDGNAVMTEKAALSIGSSTTQSLVKTTGENFYGGGTQNGRFVHTGEVINIKNESNWVDGGVASPNPFYYSSNGYGVLRNTFWPGSYDLGNAEEETVSTVHNENEFDAYYFLSGGSNVAARTQDILSKYYKVTGNPVLLPEYAFYEGHLNAYNRDSWADTEGTGWVIYGSYPNGGTTYLSSKQEYGKETGYRVPENGQAESLNGTRPTVQAENFPATATTPEKYSARAVINQYVAMDMPIGYFLPNDGYGAGYGQNGYYKTGGVNADETSSAERLAAVAANVQNLAEFTEYARKYGLETGLWTQSDLKPDSNSETPWHLLRDFDAEVTTGGVTTLKTDVAWVGNGYNFALNGTKTAYDTVTTRVSKRPNIITLDGWAGTQRFGGIWTGDQYGGNWEYIRFHIPTYIGQSLSGNPNIGSDMDGIFSGDKIISTRDTQWKIFTPLMLNMDGWGSYAKTPHTFGDPYTGINRMYLKMKAQLMPYIYTSAASAANIDTGNGDTGLPMIRAMFLEYPRDAYANTKSMQYQYMFGKDILVAPVYEETNMDDQGNDVRNGIYLPDEDQIWIDYFTGKQYRGGQTLNNYDAPIWKLPIFVKNGAIIPMWEENNNPSAKTETNTKGLDKANRIVEFWPAGSTEYTMYEDDGTTAENTQETVEGYGTVSTISYGGHVSQKFTSKVEGTTATLTAETATGNYNGYNKDKNTTFVVNVSKEPSSVTAKNGSEALTKVTVTSKEAFDSATAEAGTFVYYYDANPAVETYGVEAETGFAEMMNGKTTSPKLYVKFATTDTQANTQTLVINGFENVDSALAENVKNEALSAPTGLADNEEQKTPTSNTLTWEAVEYAESYEVLADGIVHHVGNTTTFAHKDLEYHSTHTYRVRARNAEGYSEWSDELSATTKEDPWRNVPTPQNVIWNGGDKWGALENLTDHDYSTMFHSTEEIVSNAEPLILDYDQAYEFEDLVYYPRTDLSNGTVQKMKVETSLDGIHWTTQWDGSKQTEWAYDPDKTTEENKKTISFADGTVARYVKITVQKSVGNFFAAQEIAVYKKDGSKGFAVGSTLGNATVLEGDYTNMKQYLGVSKKDGIFDTQIVKGHGDINGNDYYDVWDYAFTMFQLNGGTRKTGTVSGNILLLPNSSSVNTGDTFTVDVYAENVKNLNAFGQVLTYDPAKLQYVGVTADFDISQMENLTVNKVYEDGTAYVNLAFANNGNQEVYSGTGILATITMKAKEAFTFSEEIMNLSSVMLIGPTYSLVESASGSGMKEPQISTGGEKSYAYGTDFTMTMTNDVLTTDDGNNVQKLIQTSKYDGLFNGTKTKVGETDARDFELKWDTNLTTTVKAMPDYVKTPLTFHITPAEGKNISSVTIENANKANGYVTKASAVFYYEGDAASEKQTVTLSEMIDYAEFKFNNPDATKRVVKADVTVETVINGSGQEVNNMMTLSSMTVKADETTALSYSNHDFTLTMTNEVLTTDDDGANVGKMIQSGNYAGLFTGGQGRNFELKWDWEGNYVDKQVEYVHVPLTLHATMTEAKTVDSVILYNANKGNGYVPKASAVFHYADDTASTEDVITLAGDQKTDYASFTFDNPDKNKLVKKVDVIIKEAEQGNEINNQLLTLSEMEIKTNVAVTPITSIASAESNENSAYVGKVLDVDAVLTPNDATNPYYQVTSSDEGVVRIVKVAGPDGYPVYKAYTVGAGTATITLTTLESVGSETPVTAQYTITVQPGADKTELAELLQTYGTLNDDFYTEDSFAKLQAAITSAQAVKERDEATTKEVKQAVNALKKAYQELEETPVTEITDKSAMNVTAQYSDSNVPSNLIDGNTNSRWESPYGADASLPQEIVVSLGEPYDLDKVEIVKYNANNGKVLQYEVLVSTDNGESYTSVGTKDTAKEEMTSGIRMKVQDVTHVKVKITKALDADGVREANYADLTEINFYGVKSAAAGDLQKPATDLTIAVNKGPLGTVIESIQSLKKADYTEESWNALQTALSEAKEVMEDETATAPQVAEAWRKLETAKASLIRKSENVTPNTPAAPGTPSASGDSSATNDAKPSETRPAAGNSSNSSTNSTSSTSTAGGAATGDLAQPILYMALAMAAGAVLAALKKRETI